MIVVFDSNILISDLCLNSKAGSATRYFLKKHKAKIALPEVIRLEIEYNFRNELNMLISDIKNNYNRLLMVFGKLKEIVLPSDKDVEKKVKELFENLGVDLIECPFTFESARSSFIKTVEKLPPSDKQQQFKDGVIWADCINLLDLDDVCLVTSDKAFYKERDYKKGLAENLKAEAEQTQHSLKLIPNRSELLNDIRKDITIDEVNLAENYANAKRTSIDNMLNKNGFVLGERLKVNRTLYITEQPDTLYVEFTIEYECIDISGEERENAKLFLSGNGNYQESSATFTNLGSDYEELTFKIKNGDVNSFKNYSMSGTMSLGHKDINYSLRYPLD